MKFCKNLQRVVDLSDPEWAPYWTNYKMLKKLIKELPSLVPSGEDMRKQNKSTSCPGSPSSVVSSVSSVSTPPRSHQKDSHSIVPSKYNNEATTKRVTDTYPDSIEVTKKPCSPPRSPSNPIQSMGRSPGEIAFFKMLHSELRKAVKFFGRAQQEFIIRDERVSEGMEIMKKSNCIMVNDRWLMIAKSIYRLYKDLLLLETFAIMTYCSFSKILKKHDKVTGYSTRSAFMSNLVNKANFTSYPTLLEMITRCAGLYEEISERLMSEGKQSLYEDERLFINMIHRLNEQVLDTAKAEESPRSKAVAISLRETVSQEKSPPNSKAIKNYTSLKRPLLTLSNIVDTSKNSPENAHEQKKKRIHIEDDTPQKKTKPIC